MAVRRPVLSLVTAGVRRVVARFTETPVARAVRRQVHQAEFAAGRATTDSFGGCYANFAEAEAAAPAGLIGYNHGLMANFFQADADATAGATLRAMDPNDYAVLFWMREALRAARGEASGAAPPRVFDLGGYVGSAYYNYRRYLDYPAGLAWTVCDVPAIVDTGREMARREGAAQLRFTTERDDADGADIFLAAGSLQYLEEGSLHRLIASLRAPPRHLLVQRTPLHPERSFVTLQMMMPPGGPVFCPYAIAARGPFIDGLRALGYELVDAWEKQRELVVPLHPECRVPAYSGLYFRRADGG